MPSDSDEHRPVTLEEKLNDPAFWDQLRRLDPETYEWAHADPLNMLILRDLIGVHAVLVTDKEKTDR